MPKQAYGPSDQAMTPGNRYNYTIFLESDLIYSHQGKWGGYIIFSFLGRALQNVIEAHSFTLHALQISTVFSRTLSNS